MVRSHLSVQAIDSNAFGDGAVLGCDFVGEVVELGDSVTRLVKGDVVAGLIWGGESLFCTLSLLRCMITSY